MSYKDGLVHMMSHPAGREFVWEQLARGQIFASSFNADPLINAYNAGRRDVMLPLYQEIEAEVPHLMEIARKEAHERSRRQSADTIERNDNYGDAAGDATGD